MSPWKNYTLAGLGVTLIAFLAIVFVGAHRIRTQNVELENELVWHSIQETAPRSAAGFDRLPEPVSRYFDAVLPNGRRLIRLARFKQRGELRIDDTKDRWSSFEANQIVAPAAVGFIWNARVRMAPMLHVRVRDAFVGLQGMGAVSFMSAIPMSAENGGAELSAGELYRFLAEAPWYPTALLPTDRLRWSAIDSHRASATLEKDGITVSVEFHFAESGEVSGIFATGRSRREGAEYKPTPWEGHFGTYEVHDGIRVPGDGDVGWYLSGRWQPVWRGRMTEIDYEFSN